VQDDRDRSGKAELRRQLVARRRALSASEIAAARSAVAGHVLAQVASRPWVTCVAAYQPLRTEPGSTELLDGLRTAGIRLLLPVTMTDNDLDWTEFGTPLGVSAIAAADLILVPALAVDARGNRLGRGGGSYDRALLRARSQVTVAALIYDLELVDALPSQAWDVKVSAAVSPSGWHPVGR
jgi:5-formyltetrahydrofolate cyclo-ligase